jgi:precorrin-2 dehydrogenase/sirohydrochlorin ferrochelatase
VAVEVTPRLEQLARNGRINLFRRQYRETDLEGVFLVFAATGNAELNRRIGEEARNRDILCNIADRPRDSDFISPAVVTRGDLMITVSTGGACPAYAKRVRESLEALFDRRIDEFLRLMRQIRNRLLQTHDPDAHKILFTRLVKSGLDQMIVSGDTESAKRVLVEILGTDEDLNALEISKG